METILVTCQVLIALAVVNVWVVRQGIPTRWRGGDAQTLREEFTAYGLPDWAMTTVGALKLGLAAALVAGIWYPALVGPSAIVLTLLMLSAVAMHVRIADPWAKSIPALSLLLLSSLVAFAA